MDLKSYQNLRILAGMVLIASSITHLVQLAIVGFEWHDIAAAVIGGLYGLLGAILLLFDNNKPLTFTGIVFPFIGGTLGFVRLISIEIGQYGNINWFIVWHLIADAIIVPSLFFYYIFFTQMNKQRKLSFLTIVLLVITGIMHILQLYFGISLENIGQAVFGIIYISLGMLLTFKADVKGVHVVAIDLPIIGAVLGLILFFFIYNPFLIFFIIVDVFVVYLRIYIYQTHYKEREE
jgi:hypothetical protein